MVSTSCNKDQQNRSIRTRHLLYSHLETRLYLCFTRNITSQRVSWDATSCNLADISHHFRGTCHLHLQARRVSSAEATVFLTLFLPNLLYFPLHHSEPLFLSFTLPSENGPFKGQYHLHCSPYSHWFAQGHIWSSTSPYSDYYLHIQLTSTLKMEATYSSETLVMINHNTWCHLRRQYLHSHCYDILTPQMIWLFNFQHYLGEKMKSLPQTPKNLIQMSGSPYEQSQKSYNFIQMSRSPHL
jgi:hypothetical protein